MSKAWSEAVEGRIPTKNKMGFMFTEIAGASPIFLQDIMHHQNSILVDLGCAYGVVTLPALQHSSCQITAFDLSSEHLEELKLLVPADKASQLRLQPGCFPRDFNFIANSLNAIHSSYMFHFLNGEDTEQGLLKCWQALKPGGKIYINTISAFFEPFGFLSVYEKNSADGIKWPGEIFNLQQRAPKQDLAYAPDFFHVHKLEDFKRLIVNSGFHVEQIFYYDLKEPAWFASANKGSIAAIATKPL